VEEAEVVKEVNEKNKFHVSNLNLKENHQKKDKNNS
jgi:hypothetical protein